MNENKKDTYLWVGKIANADFKMKECRQLYS